MQFASSHKARESGLSLYQVTTDFGIWVFAPMPHVFVALSLSVERCTAILPIIDLDKLQAGADNICANKTESIIMWRRRGRVV